MSIATAIQAAQTKVANAYVACNSQGATMPAAANQNLSNLASTILSIPTGGGSTIEPDEDDVLFIDYDGTLLYHYSFAQFLALSAMPANPSHTGLTAQGWNWTLSDAQTAATAGKDLVIGQQYTTSDGKTKYYLTVADTSYSMIEVFWQQTKANGVTVDWGDGSSTETVDGTGTKSLWHEYSTTGDYIISLDVTNGTAILGDGGDHTILVYHSSGGVVRAWTKKIHIGNNITGIATKAVRDFRFLEELTIPSTVTSLNNNYTFSSCCKLKGLVIPSSITSIPEYCFEYCYVFKYISLPKTVTTINNYAFRTSDNIKRVNLGNVTSIGRSGFHNDLHLIRADLRSATTLGQDAFCNCYRLTEVNISSVTNIGTYAFRYCQNLERVSTINATTWGTNVFENCNNLNNVVISGAITTLQDYTFSGCGALSNVTLPNTLTTINQYAFNGCKRLNNLTIPSSVKTINQYAFQDNQLSSVDLSNITSIGRNAFYGSYNFTGTFTLPAVTNIPTAAFQALAHITTLIIPEGVQTFADSACRYCSAQTIHLPSTVTSITGNAFDSAVQLAEFIIDAVTPPTMANVSALSNTSNAPIYIPASSLSAYKTASNWSTYKKRFRPWQPSENEYSLTNGYSLMNGSPVANTQCAYSDYIAVDDTHSYTICGGASGSTTRGVEMYDSSKNYIGYWNYTSLERTTNMSSGTAYVRMIVYRVRGYRAYLYDNTTDELIWPVKATS